jgi:hypothetical protein
MSYLIIVQEVLKEKDNKEDPVVEGRELLKQFLKKYDGRL